MRPRGPVACAAALLALAGQAGCGGAEPAVEAATPPVAAADPTAGTPAAGQFPAELIAAAQQGDLATVARRIALGDNPGAVDPEGRTALMYAAFDGHTPVVRALIDARARLDSRDPLGRTALLYAATGPFPETVELLLERGADPHVADTGERFNALMHAAAEGHAAVVEVLLRYGADPGVVDADGDTALDFARRNGHADVVRLLAPAAPQ